MQNIMNDISRMSRLKQRDGLNITHASNAASEYILMVRINKKIRLAWKDYKQDFEIKHSKKKGYQHNFIASFILTLQTISDGKLKNLDKDFDLRGNKAIEDYLLTKMEMRTSIIS